jgi:hypothetical protein
LKNWTVKYGPEEKVQQIMNQYRTFVSKNKIFQEFQKAYVEFVQVCDEYKKDGDISKCSFCDFLIEFIFAGLKISITNKELKHTLTPIVQ